MTDLLFFNTTNITSSPAVYLLHFLLFTCMPKSLLMVRKHENLSESRLKEAGRSVLLNQTKTR